MLENTSWRNCTTVSGIFKIAQVFLLFFAIGIYRSAPLGTDNTRFLVIGVVIGFIIMSLAHLLGYFFGQGTSMQEALLNFIGSTMLVLSAGLLLQDAEHYHLEDVSASQAKARACAAFQLMAAGLFLFDTIAVIIKLKRG